MKYLWCLLLAGCALDQTPRKISGDTLWAAAQEWNAVCPGVFVRDDTYGTRIYVGEGFCPYDAWACTYQGESNVIWAKPKTFKLPIHTRHGLFVHELGHNLYLDHRLDGDGVMAIPQNKETPTPEDVKALNAVGWDCPERIRIATKRFPPGEPDGGYSP